MIHEVESFDHVAIHKDDRTGQLSLTSLSAFKKGDVISDFSAKEVLENPTYLTVQLSTFQHIKLEPFYLQCINHSCQPNVYFDLKDFKLIALKDIEVADELTFFYPSTEWEMIQPFDCKCGYSNCIGFIKGAKFLPSSLLNQYQLSLFIESCLYSNN